MIPQIKILLITCFVFVCQALYSQSNFSFGPAFTVGYPTAPTHAYLITKEAKSTPTHLRDQLMVANGLMLRYMIGNRFGVESGLGINAYNYILQNETKDLQKFIGWGATIHLYDFQVPLLFVLQVNHPSNPYRNFKFVGGTSYDFMSTEILTKVKAMPWLHTLIAGFRLGTNKIKKVTCEYGIEYQYGRPFSLQAVDYKFEGDQIGSRQNFLAFKLHLFVHPGKPAGNSES